MSNSSIILNSLLSRTGCGYLLINSELQIVEASENIAQFNAGDPTPRIGRPLIEEFPELKEKTDKLTGLFSDAKSQVRFRIKRDENCYVMASVQQIGLDAPTLLVLFEDISLLVLRTEVLGRRVKELESRCQYLEKSLLSNTGMTPSGTIEPHFDPDTGLYDVDYLIGRLVEEEAFSRRWKRPFSVLVLRFEGFSKLSSGYLLSPKQQRQRLKPVAELARTSLRSMDTLGCLDESGFIALLPQTPREGAQITADRILKVVQDHHFDKLGRVSLRIGIAELEFGQDDTALKIFERAKQNAQA